MHYDFELSEMEFMALREFIHENFGFYFKDDKRSFMQMKLYPRLISLGLASFDEYLQKLKYGADNRMERSMMMSLLTNTETYFFRETPQLDWYHEKLLPELRDKKMSEDKKSIRVLSAGCSSGEEVYSLAMLAFETGSFFWGWDLKVIGMDINELALQKARKGLYHSRSFRMAPAKYTNKFFTQNSEGMLIKESVKKMTEFRSGNIANPEDWRELRDIDIIFCRNVLIYFSDEKTRAALDNIHEALAPGGHLLLGHSETLTGLNYDFEPIRCPNTIIYRKR